MKELQILVLAMLLNTTITTNAQTTYNWIGAQH